MTKKFLLISLIILSLVLVAAVSIPQTPQMSAGWSWAGGYTSWAGGWRWAGGWAWAGGWSWAGGYTSWAD